MHVMTLEFGVASQIEKIDTLDFATLGHVRSGHAVRTDPCA